MKGSTKRLKTKEVWIVSQVSSQCIEDIVRVEGTEKKGDK